MEEKLIFKNKGLRRLCMASIFFCCVIAVVYLVCGFINLKNCLNTSRFFWRALLLCAYTFEFSLFANRSSIYMELGGDFSLARRSASIMFMTLCFSAMVEAYYVSVFLGMSGKRRIIAMCIIIAVGLVTLLPLIQFQYLNLNMAVMLPSVIAGVVASLAMFIIGLVVIGVMATRVGGTYAILSLVSRVSDSIAPIYVSYIPSCIILLSISRIMLVKEMKLEAKLAPSSHGGDEEKDDNIEDL